LSGQLLLKIPLSSWLRQTSIFMYKTKSLLAILTFLLTHLIAIGQLSEIISDYESFYKEKKENEQWPDLSEQAFLKEKVFLRKIVDRLNTLPKGQLEDSERINWEMLQLVASDNLFHLDFQSHLFPLNAEGGFITDLVYSIQSTYIKDQESFDKYVQKLIKLPEYFNRRELWMKKGIKTGKMSPKLVVKNCIDLLDNFLKKAPENTFFMNPVKGNVLRTAVVTELLNDKIFPAYKKLKDFLEKEYLKNAPETIGISEITDGKLFYEQRVRYYTTLDITPQEIFDIGMSEVTRIRSEMEAIIKSLNFEGSFADFLKFLRTDPQFYAKDGLSLLKEAAWITKKMEGQLPKYFGKLPRMPLTVTPVPAAIAENYTAGRYSGGDYKNQKHGQYWVNTTKLASRPLYVLPALSLHEGVPGHHTQIMLAKEIENVPEFRKSTYLSAYGEGWGLYSEYLGKEAGMYTTPYEQFGALVYEMWRACRLVVDPGMHYFGWSRQKAFDFMAENTALSIHEVNTEINRYIGWPGQAVSYKMGEIKIKELRKKAEQTLGDKFDIRAFHDLILSQGSVPMKTLEGMVNDWIEEQ